MFRYEKVQVTARREDKRQILVRRMILTAVASVIFALLFASLLRAQPAPVTGDARGFFQSIAGEWIGSCEQTTDGEQADNKYFRAEVKQVDDNNFTMNYEYYRFDKKTNTPLRIGDTQIQVSVGADGTVTSKATGKGIILVNEKPKNQTFQGGETVSFSDGKLLGKGSGTISVSGMPLGLGKNGKIEASNSNWVLKDGVLSIEQTVRAKFKALVFSKSFNVVAKSTAVRGSDVVELMTRKSQVVTTAGPKRS